MSQKKEKNGEERKSYETKPSLSFHGHCPLKKILFLNFADNKVKNIE